MYEERRCRGIIENSRRNVVITLLFLAATSSTTPMMFSLNAAQPSNEQSDMTSSNVEELLTRPLYLLPDRTLYDGYKKNDTINIVKRHLMFDGHIPINRTWLRENNNLVVPKTNEYSIDTNKFYRAVERVLRHFWFFSKSSMDNVLYKNIPPVVAKRIRMVLRYDQGGNIYKKFRKLSKLKYDNNAMENILYRIECESAELSLLFAVYRSTYQSMLCGGPKKRSIFDVIPLNVPSFPSTATKKMQKLTLNEPSSPPSATTTNTPQNITVRFRKYNNGSIYVIDETSSLKGLEGTSSLLSQSPLFVRLG